MSDLSIAYQIQNPNILTTFNPAGSTAGYCNIMGYWFTNNVGSQIPSKNIITKDSLICTNACTLRFVDIYRQLEGRQMQLIENIKFDFSCTDTLFSSNDYLDFPDLQMLPAVGSGIVTPYNITLKI